MVVLHLGPSRLQIGMSFGGVVHVCI
jgi:hypothetical protein